MQLKTHLFSGWVIHCFLVFLVLVTGFFILCSFLILKGVYFPLCVMFLLVISLFAFIDFGLVCPINMLHLCPIISSLLVCLNPGVPPCVCQNGVNDMCFCSHLLVFSNVSEYCVPYLGLTLFFGFCLCPLYAGWLICLITWFLTHACIKLLNMLNPDTQQNCTCFAARIAFVCNQWICMKQFKLQ